MATLNSTTTLETLSPTEIDWIHLQIESELNKLLDLYDHLPIPPNLYRDTIHNTFDQTVRQLYHDSHLNIFDIDVLQPKPIHTNVNLIELTAAVKEMEGMTWPERWNYISRRQTELNHYHNPSTKVTFMDREWDAFELRKIHNMYSGLELPIFETTTFTPNTYFYIKELGIILQRYHNGVLKIARPIMYSFFSDQHDTNIAFHLKTRAKTRKVITLECF